MTGEDIQRRLVDFARKWSVYDGTERAEAQTFLNELFACYGTDRFEAGARLEEPQEGRFVDLLWERRCIVEMKRPSEAGRLASHRPQALDYWRNAADPSRNIPAPRFVVLCAFRRFEVWEPGAFPNEPRAEFDLLELPDRVDTLMFLAEREPVFVASQAAVTRQAVSLVTGLFRILGDRRAAGPDVLRDFLLQSVWCMFAEDLGQLEGHLFTQIIDDLIANPRRSSADDLGQLFEWLNRPGERAAGGIYARDAPPRATPAREGARPATRARPPRIEPERARRVLPPDEHQGHRDQRLRGGARPCDPVDGAQARRRRA